jgi:hypothetical protein
MSTFYKGLSVKYNDQVGVVDFVCDRSILPSVHENIMSIDQGMCVYLSIHHNGRM